MHRRLIVLVAVLAVGYSLYGGLFLATGAVHEELVDELPDAELAVVEDAGHLAMIERPRAFNAALREFLERRLDATG